MGGRFTIGFSKFFHVFVQSNSLSNDLNFCKPLVILNFIILMNVANDVDFLPQYLLIAVLMKCFNLEDIIFACYSLMNNDTLEQKVNKMGYIRAV